MDEGAQEQRSSTILMNKRMDEHHPLDKKSWGILSLKNRYFLND